MNMSQKKVSQGNIISPKPNMKNADIIDDVFHLL